MALSIPLFAVAQNANTIEMGKNQPALIGNGGGQQVGTYTSFNSMNSFSRFNTSINYDGSLSKYGVGIMAGTVIGFSDINRASENYFGLSKILIDKEFKLTVGGLAAFTNGNTIYEPNSYSFNYNSSFYSASAALFYKSFIVSHTSTFGYYRNYNVTPTSTLDRKYISNSHSALLGMNIKHNDFVFQPRATLTLTGVRYKGSSEPLSYNMTNLDLSFGVKYKWLKMGVGYGEADPNRIVVNYMLGYDSDLFSIGLHSMNSFGMSNNNSNTFMVSASYRFVTNYKDKLRWLF